MALPRRPLPRPPRSDAEIDTASVVHTADVQRASASWRASVQGDAKALLDAVSTEDA